MMTSRTHILNNEQTFFQTKIMIIHVTFFTTRLSRRPTWPNGQEGLMISLIQTQPVKSQLTVVKVRSVINHD